MILAFTFARVRADESDCMDLVLLGRSESLHGGKPLVVTQLERSCWSLAALVWSLHDALL